MNHNCETVGHGRLSTFSTRFSQDPKFPCITFKMSGVQFKIPWNWRTRSTPTHTVKENQDTPVIRGHKYWNYLTDFKGVIITQSSRKQFKIYLKPIGKNNFNKYKTVFEK